MKDKVMEYFKHVLVIFMDYGQYTEEYSRVNLRFQQFFYLGAGILLGLYAGIEAAVSLLIISEVLNFVIWYKIQRDKSLQDKKKEMLEEVIG